MKTALQDWLNPEDSTDELTSDSTPTESTGYTLNVKQKEEVSDNDFDDLFKD